MSKFIAGVAAISVSLGGCYAAERLNTEPAAAIASAASKSIYMDDIPTESVPIDQVSCNGDQYTNDVIPSQSILDAELVSFYAGGGSDGIVEVNDLNEAELPLATITDERTHALAQYAIDKNAAETALSYINGGANGIPDSADFTTAEAYIEYIDCDALHTNMVVAIKNAKSAANLNNPSGTASNVAIDSALTTQLKTNELTDPLELLTDDSYGDINPDIAYKISPAYIEDAHK